MKQTFIHFRKMLEDLPEICWTPLKSKCDRRKKRQKEYELVTVDAHRMISACRGPLSYEKRQKMQINSKKYGLIQKNTD